MKTLVVRPGRRAALNSREPKINRSPAAAPLPRATLPASRGFMAQPGDFDFGTRSASGAATLTVPLPIPLEFPWLAIKSRKR